MADRIPSTKIGSLKDFIAAIAEMEDEDILFRGQHEDWALSPKIARIVHRKDITKEPKRVEIARKMLLEFERESVPYLSVQPKTELERLALAQHHGMPTPLLDWTKNALAALWFAVKKPAEKKKHAVVWCLHVPDESEATDDDHKDPFQQSWTKVYQPRFVTARIQAQAGWFTLHQYNSEKKNFLALEQDVHYKTFLRKFEIPPEEKVMAKIRYDIDRCGITQASLFPDLDGLCEHIAWTNSVLKDEKWMHKASSKT